MINLTYQFKLKLTHQQTHEVENILEVCRRVYNYALCERKHWLNSRKSPINACSIVFEYIIPADVPYPNYNNQSKAPRFLWKAQRKLKLLQRRLKHKIKGSNNWLKLQRKIALLHESVANTRKDWHFKLAHHLCDLADNIFVEDINFISWSRGIVRKRSLESGIGQFINEILPYISWKRCKFYLKVDKNGTSQECPSCHQPTGKKRLNQRVHSCQFCGHEENRDTASAKVVEYRGKIAVGLPVIQNACGDVLAGVKQRKLFDLAKCL